MEEQTKRDILDAQKRTPSPYGLNYEPEYMLIRSVMSNGLMIPWVCDHDMIVDNGERDAMNPK